MSNEKEEGVVKPDSKIVVPRKQDLITSIYEEDDNGKRQGPSSVVPRDPKIEEMPELIEFVGSEVGLMVGTLDQSELDKYAPPGVNWEWEDYQLEYLDTSENYISNKARQVGLSASFAAKAFARGILTTGRNYNAIFTSYKKEEAVGKVRTVKQYLSALPPRFQKKIIRDPQQLIEWENRDGTRCKVISHAQRPIRGVHGDIFLDELAFYQFGDLVYESAFAATKMMGGTMDITSTPFGKFGKFYEIYTNKAKYPDFKRRWIYWWDCKRYLKEPPKGMTMDEWSAWVSHKAPTYGFSKDVVEERVYKYGNDKIKSLFRNSTDIISFMQEFEGHFVDEEASFISRDLIFRCMYPTFTSLIDDYDPQEGDFNIPIEEALADQEWPMVDKYENVNFRLYNSLEELRAAIYRGDVSHRLIAGADIGTTHDSTEFTILEEVQLPNGGTLQVERFHLSKVDWELPDQQQYFASVLRQGFIRKLRMDCTGIGTQMGQALDNMFPGTFTGLQMGGSSNKQDKEMTNLKQRMAGWGLAIGYDKQKVSDMHSIRRVVTDKKNISYKADTKKRHHADYAWAVAFASLAGTPFGEEPVTFDLSKFSDMSITVGDSLGRGANFVDEFRRDVLNKGSSGGFGSSLSIGPTEDFIMDNVFSPGGFINNHDEG